MLRVLSSEKVRSSFLGRSRRKRKEDRFKGPKISRFESFVFRMMDAADRQDGPKYQNEPILRSFGIARKVLYRLTVL